MHWLRVVQSELCDVLFNAPAHHDPGMRYIIHHRTNIDFDPVTTKMFRDQNFQHWTDFGVVVYDIFG